MALPSLATGGLSALSERERAAGISNQGDLARAVAAQNAAALRAAADENVADKASGSIRGTGTLTQYRPRGGWRTPGPGAGVEAGGGNLRAAAETAELGAPTSFKGGAGAPAPIGVIRGLRQTFAPQQQPGEQFIEGEYSTPLRAAQAYNRAAGAGEFEPVEGPKFRLAAALDQKNPDKVVQASMVKQAQFGRLLNDRLLKEYGVEDKEKGLVLPSSIQRLALGHLPQSMEDVESILQQVKPEADKWKSVNIWNEPKTGMAMRQQLLATTTDPAEQKRIKEEMVTPETIEWFEERRHGSQAPPATSNNLRRTVADTGLVAGALDQATLLGKRLGYELQPSLRREGVPEPTLKSVREGRFTERKRIWDEENLRAVAQGR